MEKSRRGKKVRLISPALEVGRSFDVENIVEMIAKEFNYAQLADKNRVKQDMPLAQNACFWAGVYQKTTVFRLIATREM